MPKGKRRVHVSREWMENMLKGGLSLSTDLPDDARLVDSWRSDVTGAYVFVFESDWWESVEEGQEIPKISVEAKALWEDI